MEIRDSVYSESSAYAFYKTFFTPALRPAFLSCISSIIFNFFLRQYHSAFLGRVPVSNVDHPLDEKIPFVPSWVTIYLDFTNYWIRMVSFFLRRWGRKAHAPVGDFILSIGKLYAFAAQTYRKNLSTTVRPFYIARPRFFLIHLTDPHLMCIPSLHIMVAIHTYTNFAAIARLLGKEETLKSQIIEMRHGAMAISQSILYVKQHSVNCIAASLYAMHCFDPVHFPESEAGVFLSMLFNEAPAPDGQLNPPVHFKEHPSYAPKTKLSENEQTEIKNHIMSLYKRFLSEKSTAKTWEEPLINFMKPLR